MASRLKSRAARWRAFAPIAATSSGSSARAARVAASAPPSPAGTQAPARPRSTTRRSQPSRLTTTGRPAASESKNLFGELVSKAGCGANRVSVTSAAPTTPARRALGIAGRTSTLSRPSSRTRPSRCGRRPPSPIATIATSWRPTARKQAAASTSWSRPLARPIAPLYSATNLPSRPWRARNSRSMWPGEKRSRSQAFGTKTRRAGGTPAASRASRLASLSTTMRLAPR